MIQYLGCEILQTEYLAKKYDVAVSDHCSNITIKKMQNCMIYGVMSLYSKVVNDKLHKMWVEQE